MPNIQIRGDLLFQFAHDQLGGQNYRFFHLNEFISRVEKYIPNGDNEVRYGILVDFDKDESIYQKSYMVEIPTSARTTKDRQTQQEELIKQYVDEMREKFSSYFKNVVNTGMRDQYDKMKRKLKSSDGLWSILRGFRECHLISFSEWLFNTQFTTKSDAESYLVRSRMTFETDKKYLVSVDWPNPYICFEHEYQVAHFDTDSKNAGLFYPFHNFSWQKLDLCTEIEVERDTDYAKRYERGIEIKPNNYALFAYYTFLIDNICKLQQENYEITEPYYQSVQNLSAIQKTMLEFGPLSNLSEAQVKAIDTESIKDWDGGVSDGSWKQDHIAEFALGMADIGDLINVLNGVLSQESKTGRNANRSVQIQSLAYSLKQSLLDSELSKVNYTDLWAFNADKFAYDLILRKSMLILSQMEYAQEIYNDYLIDGLYEHPILDETLKGAKVPEINFAEWGNIFYRNNAITFEMWMGFYSIREEFLQVAKNQQYTNIANSAPKRGAIYDWITKNEVFPNSIVGSSTASGDYTSWKLNDVQTRKLANYLLGGGADAKLAAIEEKLASEIQRLFGTVEFKHIPFDRIDELQKILVKLKQSLVETHLPEAKLESLGHTANFAASGLNLYLSVLAYSNAYSPGATLETKLRAHTVALGLFSDVANTVGKFRGVQATMLRSVAARAGGKAALRLGMAEFLGGGVGGVIGIAWFAWDAYGSFAEGFGKDGALDTVSAIGCAISTVGLFLAPTGIGSIVGVICSVVGIVMVLTAQLLKYFRTFNSTSEDFCKFLYGKSMEEGGTDRLSHWRQEMENYSVAIPTVFFTSADAMEKLTERVDEFMVDWDTFDHVRDM